MYHPQQPKPGMSVSGWQNKHMPGSAVKNPSTKATPQNHETRAANVTYSSNDVHRTFRKIRKSPNRFRVSRPAFRPLFAKTPNTTNRTNNWWAQRPTNRPLGLRANTPAQKHHQQFTIVSPVPPPTAQSAAHLCFSRMSLGV